MSDAPVPQPVATATSEILKVVGPIKVKLTSEELRVCQKASNGDAQAYAQYQAERAASLILVVPRDKAGTLGDGAIGVVVEGTDPTNAALTARNLAYFRSVDTGVWEYLGWRANESAAPLCDPWGIFRWIVDSGMPRGINKLGGK